MFSTKVWPYFKTKILSPSKTKKRGVELGKNGKVLAARNRGEKERFKEYLLEQIPNASMMTLSEIARRLKDSGQLTRRGTSFSIVNIRRYIAL